MNRISKAAIGLSALALLAANSASAQDGVATNDGWQFTLTPYLWIPGYDGNLNFPVPPGGTGDPHVHAGPVDVFDNLDAAFMGTASAKKGKWGAFTDFAYVDVSGDGNIDSITGPGGEVDIPVNVATSTGLQGSIWTLAGTYEVYRGQKSVADAFAGVRLLDAEANVSWAFPTPTPLGLIPQTGTVSDSANVWDAIVGVKGKYGFNNSNWFLNYYGDIGTGESDFTYQVMGGVGYAFNWGDLLLDYRLLHYDTDDGADLVDNLDLYGPAFGATFRF